MGDRWRVHWSGGDGLSGVDSCVAGEVMVGVEAVRVVKVEWSELQPASVI